MTLAAAGSDFDPTGRESPVGRTSGSTGGSSTRATSRPAPTRGEITLVNWPQNDYWLGDSSRRRARGGRQARRRAKQLSLSLLYWLQTEAPAPTARPAGRACGSARPRRHRRRPGQVPVHPRVAADPGRVHRPRAARRHRGPPRGTEDARTSRPSRSPTSVGVGSYRIDLHPSTGGDNYIDISSLPFQVPLGALIPRRVENLLPACKNLGTTHITNGCYRLHPVEWAIGEAAGLLAAQASRQSSRRARCGTRTRRLKKFQGTILAQGSRSHGRTLGRGKQRSPATLE